MYIYIYQNTYNFDKDKYYKAHKPKNNIDNQTKNSTVKTFLKYNHILC